MKATEPQSDLSVIIVSWNTRDLLAQCLESVVRQQSPDLRQQSNSAGHLSVVCTLSSDVWVVDNASSDGSAAMVRERFPQVRLIENRENVGFARANNQGIRASTGRYVLLLNSDTIVEPDALTRMVEFMDAHPDAGIVGAYIRNPDRSPQYCFGRFPTITSETVFAFGLDLHRPFSARFAPQVGFEEDFIETDWVLGAGLMVRRQALDRVGLFDEDYFMYSEEVDLAYRVKKAGWKVFVLRDARIVHYGGQSAQQMAARMKAELFKSKVKFFRKHYGGVNAALLQGVLLASVLVKQLAYLIMGRGAKSALWAATRRYLAQA